MMKKMKKEMMAVAVAGTKSRMVVEFVDSCCSKRVVVGNRS